MLKGFKEFIMRGNVIDLAVGVVIGAAFNSVVTTFTASALQPVIKLITGGSGMTPGVWRLRGHKPTDANYIAIDYSAVINAIITFLLTAAVVYFCIVLPMNKLAERRARGQEPEPDAPAEETLLLREIRDALQNRN